MKKFALPFLLAVCWLPGALRAAAPSVRAVDNFRTATGPVIVPQVREMRLAGGRVALPAKFTVAVPAGEELIAEQLSEAAKRLPGVAVRAAGEGDAFCRFTVTGNGVPEHEQGYTLTIGKEGIRVASRSTAGLFYGAQTLRNLLRNAAKPELDALEIADWPDMDRRGFFFSVRWLSPAGFAGLKRAIDAMASLKINWVLLELAENFPFEGNPMGRKQTFTPEQMRELADFCRVRHIEFTPSLQLWSHALWLAKYPGFAETMRDGAPNTPWNTRVCPHSKEAREAVTKLVNEQIDFFKPRAFFIMLDEIYLDQKGKCPKCKADPDLAETYAEFLKFHEKLLLDRGIQVLVCQDSFLETRWKFGGALRQALDPADRIVWWNYHDRVGGEDMPLFGERRIVGHPIAGKPNNVRQMLRAIRRRGSREIALTFWYYSNSGLFTNESETPDSLGGFVNAADYCWHFRDEDYAEFPYDGTFEMIRRLYPERAITDPAPRIGTPVPLAGAVNAELNADGRFPRLGEAELKELAALLAARPEQFRLLTSPGGKYYSVIFNGDTANSKGCDRVSFPLGGNKAKGLSLLLTASAPELKARRDYLSCAIYGKKRYKYEPAAFLVLKYADGAEKRVPLRYRKDFTDWNRPFGGFNTRFVARGLDADRAWYSLSVFEFKNPRPETPLVSAEFVSAKLDGVAPALLAISLLGAERAASLAEPPVDPALVAGRPSPRGGEVPAKPEIRVAHDFADGMGEVKVEGRGEGFATRPKTEIVDDPTSPHGGKVLKITVLPPADPQPSRYYRVDVTLPCRIAPGETKSMVLATKLVCGDGFSHANEYLLAAGDFHWGRTVFCFPVWFRSAAPAAGRGISDKPLTDFSAVRKRMVSFFFTSELAEPAEIYIGRFEESSGTLSFFPPWRQGAEAEPY